MTADLARIGVLALVAVVMLAVNLKAAPGSFTGRVLKTGSYAALLVALAALVWQAAVFVL